MFARCAACGKLDTVDGLRVEHLCVAEVLRLKRALRPSLQFLQKVASLRPILGNLRSQNVVVGIVIHADSGLIKVRGLARATCDYADWRWTEKTEQRVTRTASRCNSKYE